MSLRQAVQRAALAHRFYGYRRVWAEVRREGYAVGRKPVRRLLREDNLLAIRRRKFVATTDSDHGYKVYPNLAQHLELTQVNQLWVADLTYVRLGAEFVFLAVVLDAFSRRAVGWALGRNLDASLPLAALRMAIQSRHPLPGLVHHSDRGSQYASAAYVKCLEGIQAVLSMSRAGRPWENGRCESFIKTLKQEEIDARGFGSLEELGQHVEEFLEQIYNRQRLHSALGYRSPAEFEQQQASAAGASGWRPAAMLLPHYEERATQEAR
jgi:transposase InsO family protein